jgi:hypothetical protein
VAIAVRFLITMEPWEIAVQTAVRNCLAIRGICAQIAAAKVPKLSVPDHCFKPTTFHRAAWNWLSLTS